MVKINLTPEPDFLPKLFPDNAEKFDVQALAFTEHGAIMAASVLNTQRATEKT